MYRKYIKRILDLIVGILGFPFFLISLIIFGPIIKATDKGPVFYNAKRIGKDGKLFEMFKFRSMKVNAPDIRLADGSTYNGGQIPWDYDVDVFVLSEDRQKLVQALINESNSEYYFVCTEVDEKCRNEMIRLCPKGYSSDRLHVDVFFLAGVPNDSDECATFIKRIRYLCRARYYKLVDVRSEYKGHNRAKIYVLLKKIQYLFFDYIQAHDEYIELSGRYLIKDSKNVVNANMYAGAYYIPTEWIIDTYLININGAQFRIPIHYHDILTMLFGNYMNVPTLENRINEMMTSYKNLKLYSKIEE